MMSHGTITDDTPRNGDSGNVADSVFRKVFEDAAVGMALLRADPDGGEVVYANRAASRVTGRTPAELLGQRFGASSPAEDRASLQEAWKQVAAGKPVSLERRVLTPDGSVRWIELDLVPLAGTDAAPLVAAQFRDITSRKRDAVALESLVVIDRLIAQAVSVRGALSALLPVFAEMLEFDFSALWMPARDADDLRCGGVWVSRNLSVQAFPESTRGRRLAPGDALPTRAWRTGKVETSVDLARDPSCPRRAAAAADGFHGGLAFRVQVGRHPYGVLELVSRRRIDRDPETERLVSDLAAELAVRLARKRPQHSLASSGLLLVEDDPFTAHLIEEMLASSGLALELEQVSCLADARERVIASPPACVLLDLTLPDAEGLEALVEIAKVAPDVPVVVLTGIEDEATALRAVHEGAQDYLMKRRVDRHTLSRSVRYAIERKGVQRQQLAQRLQDPVTGLPNRIVLADRVGVALARGDSSGVGLVLLNLDGFRRVNDTLGHEAGDQVLAECARRLLEAVQPEVTVASFGGDEFAVLAEGADPRSLLGLAEQLRVVLENPHEAGGEEVRLGATAGVAFGGNGGGDALVEEADAALSRGQAEGGGRVETFDDAVRERLRERLRMERELREGIEEGQLRLHYQPIVSLETGDIVSFEALVRWEHPERGLVPPFEFLPLAEESGLSAPMTAWVLAEACEQMASWRATFPTWRDGLMHVNLSAADLCSADLVSMVEGALGRTGCPAAAVCLEVTETALIGDLDLSGETLDRLKRLGVAIALDDFGTGYSSLSYLERFPIDILKLDRSFVTALRAHRRPAIVAAVASMARGLGLPSVAEGVEERAEEEELRTLGYDLAQGFLYARPLPAAEAAVPLSQQTNGGHS
jgi:diguanylate cyclase (GGDEF)-like protein/PAS domain S-box-containing protein